MSTTSSAEKFTIVSSSGSWTDISNLLYGASGEASGDGFLYLSVPNFITSLDDGSEFVSLKVEWEEKTAAPYRQAFLTGGTQFTEYLTPAAYASASLDGDAAYWGISGTPHEIFDGLKSGALKFTVRTFGTSGALYVKEVKATLTYKAADTSRASILTRAL